MYRALYRKWRPGVFEDVCGQEHVTTVLKNQVITNTVSHAYLFCGTHGTGKTTCAKILSKAVNCLSPIDGSPCGKCSACVSIDNGSATDVLEIDAASNNGVDSIRSIRDEVVYPPSMLKKRVYIIDEVHMLTDSANNALLKTLEEPPEYVLFVLATTELQKIPATILSRCQRFEFRRIDADIISMRVREVCRNENITIDDESVNLISRLSDGAMRDALSLLESCVASSNSEQIKYENAEKLLGVANNEEVVSLLAYAADGNVSAAMDILDKLYKGSRDLATLINQLTFLTRDLLVIKSLPNIGLIELSSSFCFSNSMFNMLKELSITVPKEKLLYFFDVLTEAQSRISVSTHGKKLLAEMAVIKLSEPRLVGGIEALRSRVSALESGVSIRKQVVTPSETIDTKANELITESITKKTDTPAGEKTVDTEFKFKAEFLALLKKQNGRIYAFAVGSDMTLCGDTLNITADSDIGFDMLSSDSALKLIEEAASFAIGAPTKIKILPAKTDNSTNQVSLDELV